MRRPREAVHAAVLAAAIRIDRLAKPMSGESLRLMMLRARSSRDLRCRGCGGRRHRRRRRRRRPNPSRRPRCARRVFSKRPATYDAAPRPLIGAVHRHRHFAVIPHAHRLAPLRRSGRDIDRATTRRGIRCMLDTAADAWHSLAGRSRTSGLYLTAGWVGLPGLAGRLDRAAEARAGGDAELAAGPGRAAVPGLPDLPRVRPAEDQAPSPAPQRAAACRTKLGRSWSGHGDSRAELARLGHGDHRPAALAPRTRCACWSTAPPPTPPCSTTSARRAHHIHLEYYIYLPDRTGTAPARCAGRTRARRGQGAAAAGCGGLVEGQPALLRAAARGRRRARLVPPHRASAASGRAPGSTCARTARSW